MYILKRIDTNEYYSQSMRANGYWSHDIDISKVYLASSPAISQMKRIGRYREYPMKVVEISIEEI